LRPKERNSTSKVVYSREEPHYGEMLKVWVESVVDCLMHDPGMCWSGLTDSQITELFKITGLQAKKKKSHLETHRYEIGTHRPFRLL